MLLFVLFVLLCLCDDVVAVIDFLFIFLGGGSGGMELGADLFFFFASGGSQRCHYLSVGKTDTYRVLYSSVLILHWYAIAKSS